MTLAEKGIAKIIQYIVHLPGIQSHWQSYWSVSCSTSYAAVLMSWWSTPEFFVLLILQELDSVEALISLHSLAT